jgi:threonine/homoserine/homoserine lactone efflux protein
LRQEVELAKAEAKQEATKAAKAGVEFGAAALAGHFALLFLSFAAAWGLSDLLEQPALGFVIVGVIYVIGAAVSAMQGKKDAEDLDTDLPQTTDSLQTTAKWAKDKP